MSGPATTGGHGGAAARCSTAAAQGMEREGEGVEKVEEVKEGRRHSAMRLFEEQSRGRAARDSAAPPPPPDHTAPSREAEGLRRRIAFRLQALMAEPLPFRLRQLMGWKEGKSEGKRKREGVVDHSYMELSGEEAMDELFVPVLPHHHYLLTAMPLEWWRTSWPWNGWR